MRNLALSVLSLILLAGVPALGYPMPKTSQERAERHARWRMEVAEGEQALAEGRWQVAEAAFSSVIEQSRIHDDTSLLLARALDGLGDLRRRDERWSDAERLYLEAAGLWERFLGPEQPRLALTLHNLGVVYIGLHREEEAREVLTRALSIVERALGAEAAQAQETRRALEATGRQ